MFKKLIVVLLFSLSILLLTACMPVLGGVKNSTQVPPQGSPSQPVTREAQVQSVDLQIEQTDRSQVYAIVHGNLNESCATLLEPQVSFSSNTFLIKIMVQTPSDRGCVQIITPFEKTVPLDVKDLGPGTYEVLANEVSTTFTLPGNTSQPLTTIHLVVDAYDRSVRIVDANIAIKTVLNNTFNSFLPLGGSVTGIGYVLDPTNQDEALAIGSNGPQVVEFVQDPAIYGLTIWPGNSGSQPRLAWGTGPSGLDQSSTIKISAPDGTQFDTLLTQDSPNPPTQLVPEFWSADGQSLYFSKEPLGLGGYILFGGGSSLYKINISTKAVTEIIPLGSPAGSQACLDAISIDDRYVADHCSSKIVTVRDLETGGTTTIQPPSEVIGYNFVGGARFSLDGSRLAFALAKGEQNNEQSWVAVSDSISGASKLIFTSQPGFLYEVVGWLDDQTLLLQSTNTQLCIPDCASELWVIKIDGTGLTKLGDGRFLALIAGDLKTVPPAGVVTPPVIGCNDAAQYVRDDGKDGTTYSPDTPFTKTWTLLNIGSCTWDSRYLVYQVSGTFMTQQPGYWLNPQGKTIAPGQTVVISVGMTSPLENGLYKSYWGLKDANGHVVPIKGGTNGDSFYVEINVSNGGSGPGNVSSAAIDIVPEQGSGDACTADSTYFVHARIATDGPATVSYEIGSSAGQISAGYFETDGGLSPYIQDRLVFDQADTKTIDLRFVGPYPYPDDITVLLRVNGGQWLSTKLHCP